MNNIPLAIAMAVHREKRWWRKVWVFCRGVWVASQMSGWAAVERKKAKEGAKWLRRVK